MPFRFEPEFTRQAAPEVSQVGLVIPENAEVTSALTGDARRVAESLGPPTVAPGKFSFKDVEWPPHKSLLADGAEVDSGTYKFKVKDAVVGVFDLPRWSHDEFCWSFSSSAQRDVLTALRVGQTFDVQFARWAHSLLYTAFSLETFIDGKLADRLRSADLGEEYIDHVLRVAGRGPELSALNSPSARFSKSGLQSLCRRLNKAIITPRNRLAHGRLTDREIGADMAVNALKTTVDFIWDWEESSRALLLTPMRSSAFDALIDDALLDACRNED